ncbi:SpoIIE family protein phosphatase [Nitrospinae bacterium AH_259_B05_G02_I21]|nr:SpoIIE family protein phosphatase [Nitrospinae bacterium AH_259_B05_G02_I21]
MTLHRKLVLLGGLLVTLPLVVVGVTNHVITFRHMEEQARQEAQTLATELARSTDRFLEGATAQIKTLARIPPVNSFTDHPPSVVEANLARAIATSPAFEKFYMATAQGRVTIKVRRDGKPPVKNELIKYRDYFKQAMSGRTVISDVLISNTSGLPILVLATPIAGANGPKGVLCGLIDPIRLFAHIYQLAVGSHGPGAGKDAPPLHEGLEEFGPPDTHHQIFPMVIDRSGLVIAHPDRARLFIEKIQDYLTEENRAILNSFGDRPFGHGVMTYQGQKVLFAFYEHRPTGWTHIVSRPYRDFTDSLVTTRNLTVAVLAFGILLSIALMHPTVRRITAPVLSLVASTRRVKDGHLDEQVEVTSRDEIGELGEAFNLMVTGLREREALRSAQERMRQQLESARVIQQSFLPASLPGADDPRFSLAALNHPAASIGGDYYDVIDIGGDRLGLVLGDVSGKGVPGALYMARLVSDFRFLVGPHQDSPAETLTALNKVLLGRGEPGMFVTLQYLILNVGTGVITFANAGHLPMFVRRAEGVVEAMDGPAGPPLGIVDDLSYDTAEVLLAPGEDLLLFTDGVTEAMTPTREQFSQQRLVEVFRDAPHQPEALVKAIAGAVQAFIGDAPPHDDLTLLAARWEGDGPAAD